MISNICKIEKGTGDLAAILTESEKVAVYNDLDRKQTLQLRLLCEEIDGMLPMIIDEFEGKFWIEFTDGVCKVNVSIEIPELNSVKRTELIGIAKNKKNAAAVGIVGRIRNAIEGYFLDEDVKLAMGAASSGAMYATVGGGGVDNSYLWSLEKYRGSVKKDENAEDWDELEKSVIASAADDVTVSVKGKRAEIVIVKKFS